MKFVKNRTLKMWILWKIELWKCEFCEKWDFENKNFGKSKFFKMWFFSKNCGFLSQCGKEDKCLGLWFKRVTKLQNYLKNAKLNVILTDFTGNICFDLRQELRLMQVSHGFFQERKNLVWTGWGRLFDLWTLIRVQWFTGHQFHC